MAGLKIYKRGSKIYFIGIFSENKLKNILRNLEFDRTHNLWCTEATLPVFRDLWKIYKDNFVITDTETNSWINHCKIYINRLQELQNGIKENTPPITLPDTIDYVLPPFQHQKEAIAFALNIPKCCLWLDMGLGKTYTSITIAKLRNANQNLGGVNKVIIISPRSLMYQWEEEIHRLAPEAMVYVIKGSPTRKHHIIDSIANEKFSFTIITYEGLGSSIHDLENVGFDMFILDEATKMKNPKAKRTLSVVNLCSTIPYGLSLTGMAYVSNPLDLFSQFLPIDKTVYGTNQWEFSNRYIEYVVLPFAKVIKGFKHMDELKERAYLSAFSRTKDNCLDLPPRVYQTRKLPLYDTQYNWYCNLLEQVNNIYTINDDDTETNTRVTVDRVVSMLEKFQQITSGYITADNGEFIWLDSPKYEEMLNILRSSQDSFIIWARHSFVLNKLKSYLKSHNIDATILDRRVSDERRKVVKDQFKKGQIKVLILQLQSECRGNDFTCEVSPVSSIFFENTASIEERSQAEDRQHRIGMTGTALYIDLVCEDTYDEGIKFLLDNKKRVSEYIKDKNLGIILGTGGSVEVKKTNAKHKPKTPDDIKNESLPKEILDDDLSDLGLCC